MREELHSGGKVDRHGRWWPKKDRCPAPVAPDAPPLPWSAPRLLRRFNSTLDADDAEASRNSRSVYGFQSATRACAAGVPASSSTVLASTSHASATCMDGAETLRTKRLRLLIGVHSAPAGRRRRDAIRESWMRWPSVGRSTLVCFLVGTGQLPPAALDSLTTEAALHRDLVLLRDVADVCVLSMPKAYAWWRHAATLLPSGAAHVGKFDDDTFVNVPRLEAHLDTLRCHRHLLYGTIAYSGYNPETFGKCAFSWGSVHSPYKKYRCSERGFHPPVPFATGPMQVLSAALVDQLASSSLVADFCSRAEASLDLGRWDLSEDTALGWWLSQVPNSRITYVHASKSQANNLGCKKHRDIYQRPSNDSIVIHFVKKPLGFQYLWETLNERRPHDVARCLKMAGVD